jgi:ADP-heptose:LPS heptosyltransferase
MMTTAPRLLLLRPDHLGDLLLSLPALLALRALLPEAHVTVAASPGVVEVAARCAAVDATFPIPFPPPTASDRPPGWEQAAIEIAPQLRDQFDVALLPRIDDPWSGVIAQRAAIPRRIGFDHPRTRRFLTEPLPSPTRCHVVQLAAALVRQVTGAPVQPSRAPWIVPSAADEVEADREVPRAGPPLIALHPGSGWPLKAWDTARWGALAHAVHTRFAARIIVTGGPQETDLVAQVVAASSGSAQGLAGRLTLGGLSALYRRAALVVAIDSGPLHLASAVGTPVVGIYGPADPLEFGPWGAPDQSAVVMTRLPCQPCRSLDQPPCGALVQPECLRLVDVESVMAAIARLPVPALSRPR